MQGTLSSELPPHHRQTDHTGVTAKPSHLAKLSQGAVRVAFLLKGRESTVQGEEDLDGHAFPLPQAGPTELMGRNQAHLQSPSGR